MMDTSADTLQLLYAWLPRRVKILAVAPAPLQGPRALAALAVHEAGHVVVGALVGSGATGATIEPIVGGAAGAGWSTAVRPAHVDPPLPVLSAPLFRHHRAHCFALAAKAMAGEQAEILGAASLPVAVNTGSNDAGAAEAFIAMGFHARRRRAAFGACQRFAAALLRAHWPAVIAVSDLLLAHGTIARPDIERVAAKFGLAPLRSFDPPPPRRSLQARAGAALRRLRVRPRECAICPRCGDEYFVTGYAARWCPGCEVVRRARGQSYRQWAVMITEAAA